ncbi:hypothetical protein ACSSV1_003612 [Labrenzia sp. MBR-25]
MSFGIGLGTLEQASCGAAGHLSSDLAFQSMSGSREAASLTTGQQGLGGRAQSQRRLQEGLQLLLGERHTLADDA